MQFPHSSRKCATLLAIPDIEILNIQAINCSTIGTGGVDKGVNRSINMPVTLNAGSGQHYANMRSETGE